MVGISKDRLFHFQLVAEAPSYRIDLLLEAMLETVVATDSCSLAHGGLRGQVHPSKLRLSKEQANRSLQEVYALYEV